MKLGYALGISTEHAIRSLTIGIGRQSYVVLDNIGVVFRAQEAYEWYKAEYGYDKQPNWILNATEKRQAWIEYAIKLVTEKAHALEIDPQSKKAKVERLKAQTKDVNAQLGVKVV